MVARVKAVLRRYKKSETKEDDKTVSFDNLKISLNDYTVIYHGEPFLPAEGAGALYFLAENKNQVFTREQLWTRSGDTNMWETQDSGRPYKKDKGKAQ